MTIKKKNVILAYIILCISIGTIINCTIPRTNELTQETLNPRTSALDTRTAYAIVVGVEDYPGSVFDLSYCVDDANSIYSRLYNNYGFDDFYIHLLLDSAATEDAISDAFGMISFIIDSNDVFFFYFSGHGGKGSFSNHICPYDAMTDDNKRIYDTELDTYLDWVSCSEQYIIIDSCGSGGMIDEAQASKRYFMTACSKIEDSWETSALRHGVFTYYFLRSFSSASDSNGDGIKSMEEQFAYTYARTVSYTTNMGDVQHPQQYDGVSGETVIDTTIASLILTPNGTQLDYSFYVYGHGLITILRITACCVAETITTEVFNLIPESPSSTGFGFYSGTIVVSGSNNITGYKIRVVVYWPNIPPGSPKIIELFFGDADGDNLTDLFEIDNGLDPSTNDTDSDGLDDYYEFYGTTDPTLNDTEGDGMPDGYEVFNGLDPLSNDSLSDLDGDGLNNILEYTIGSNVSNPDTDGDTMPDKWEYDNDLDLLFDDSELDFDSDGLINLLEYQLGCFANNNDTDGDTWSDGDEVAQETDPLDPDDYPRHPKPAVLGYHLLPIMCLLFVCSIALGKRLKSKLNKS